MLLVLCFELLRRYCCCGVGVPLASFPSFPPAVSSTSARSLLLPTRSSLRGPIPAMSPFRFSCLRAMSFRAFLSKTRLLKIIGLHNRQGHSSIVLATGCGLRDITTARDTLVSSTAQQILAVTKSMKCRTGNIAHRPSNACTSCALDREI